MTIRVLIADDQELVRTGLAAILRQTDDIEVVGEARNGREAVDEAHRLRPDVVLMDVRMPVMDGLEATRALAGAEASDPVRVIVLTTFDSEEYVYDALRSGASGFLLKDAPRGDLERAIRVVAAGEGLLSPAVTLRVISEFAKRHIPPDHSGVLDRLTEREREILRLLARGMTNAEIADRLVVGTTTVRTHVSHVLTKLRLRDRVQAVVLAYECGLIVPGSEDGSDE